VEKNRSGYTSITLIYWSRYPFGPYWRIEKRCFRSSVLVIGADVWLQEKASWAVLTRHFCGFLFSRASRTVGRQSKWGRETNWPDKSEKNILLDFIKKNWK